RPPPRLHGDARGSPPAPRRAPLQPPQPPVARGEGRSGRLRLVSAPRARDAGRPPDRVDDQDPVDAGLREPRAPHEAPRPPRRRDATEAGHLGGGTDPGPASGHLPELQRRPEPGPLPPLPGEPRSRHPAGERAVADARAVRGRGTPAHRRDIPGRWSTRAYG